LSVQENDTHINLLVNEGIKESRLPRNITLEYLHALPEATGVYYFYNEYGTPVYIGKSINIKKRVFQHFSKTTKKAENLQKFVNSISFELTGSELASMIHESNEIKKHRPEINKAQRTREYPYFIFSYVDEIGYQSYGFMKSSKKNEKGKTILGYYSTLKSCKSILANLCKELALCFEDDFILVDEGKTKDEKSVFLVQEGQFRGFGYIGEEELNMGMEEILEAINYQEPNPELNSIVRNYVLDKKYQHILRF